MNLITLFARREPTTDDVVKRYAPNAKRFDVVLYSDRELTQRVAVFSWFGTPPRTGQKSTMLNCFRYALTWMPRLEVHS
jgi:hypothetical protein